MAQDSTTASPNIYLNVMEGLVRAEVDRQIAQLPARVTQYIKRQEVETHALNRLPTLYACTQKGLHHQQDYAQQHLQGQITQAVRQALAAVQVDPIRLSQPIPIFQEDGSQAVLQALRACFDQPDLTWQEALGKLQQLGRQQRPLPSADSTLQRSPWQPDQPSQDIAWQPQKLQPGVFHRRRSPLPPAPDDPDAPGRP